jgi:hypothetical protein
MPVDIATMDSDIRNLWADALQSDHYYKGKGFLRMNGANGFCRHCPLGVLTDLFMITNPGIVTMSDAMNSGVVVFQDGGSQTTGELLPVVRDWAGLTSILPLVEVTDEEIDRLWRSTNTPPPAIGDGRPMSITYLNDATQIPLFRIGELILEQTV